MELKRTAAMTMLRGDTLFLRRWVAWYGSQLGKENLYIYFDGLDQEIPDFCNGTNVRRVEHIREKVCRGDRRRADFLSKEAAMLFKKEGYCIVVGTDVDEFLIPDPAMGMNLREYLSEKSCAARASLSGLGIDVGQNTREEGPLNDDAPFLGQRRYGLLASSYSKTSVLTRPVAWGSGFHRTRHHNYHIEDGLYLFHFGCVDIDRINDKLSDKGRIEEGWERHLRKRIRRTAAISSLKSTEWETGITIARKVQNNIHMIFPLFKPTMLGMKIMTRIPDRFFNLV